MRAAFPTEFDAVLLGKSREAGSFQTADGEVSYGDAYELSFESSDGLVQTCRCAAKALQEAADFDLARASRLAGLRVQGDVQVSDKGGYFRPTRVRVAKSSAQSA